MCKVLTHRVLLSYSSITSSGLDSVVVLDLVKKAGVRYDAHHNLTGIEPPELIYFMREHYADVITESPKNTIWRLIEQKGVPPTRLMRYCCAELKEHGGEGRFKITGIRHEESVKRSKRKYFEPCMRNSGTRFLNPIIDWKDEDAWEYIRTNNLPYCKLYDDGWRRIGCLFCPMSTIREKQRQCREYPKYKEAFVRAFDRMIAGRRADGKQTTWKNGEECFEWWVNEQKPKDKNDGFTQIDFL
ncbi:MAG: phosphoadenosine phosphosulfate reductase family protein [Treponemataceae bacterium]|nr:phosphoadenosine phosphosulfate reductase family protein [Treponemataceae bacterium]